MLKTHYVGQGQLGAKVRCDQCKIVYSTIQQNFDQIREHLQYTGWYSYHSEGSWFHGCPNCNNQASGAHKIIFNELMEKRKAQKQLLKQYR